MQNIDSSTSIETRGRRSLPWLLAAQTQVVFNDNAAKLALIGLIQFPGIVAGDARTILISVIAALLVLPFILFAPIAGWVADRFPKRGLLQFLLAAQVFCVGWIVVSLYSGNLTAAVAGFALLAVQSAFFSPAKQAILKELVGEKRLGVAVGWMEMLGTVAILGGSVAGAWAFDLFTPRMNGDAWGAATVVMLLLGGAAVLSLLVFHPVMRVKAQSAEPFRRAILWSHFRQLAEVWKERPLRLAMLGNAYVYALGGVLYLTLLQAGRELHGGGTGSVSESAVLFAMLGSGVAAGALAAAGVCRRRLDLGLVPVGALGMAASLAFLGTASASAPAVFFLGVSGGLFVVPVNAFLQARARDSHRGRVIAASNLLTNIAGIGAVALQFALAHWLGLGVQGQFLVLAVAALLAAGYILRLLPDSFVALPVLTVVRLFWPARADRWDRLPEGGALLVCNHVSYLDALILQASCPRRIRFVAYSGLRDVWWLRRLFNLFGVVPISPKEARQGIRRAAELLQEGEVVCVFPEGAVTRTGTIQGIREGFAMMARKAGVPVVPVCLDGLWGSFFTFAGNRFFGKWPRRPGHPLRVMVGRPVPAGVVSAAGIFEDLLLLGNEAFESRRELDGHLGRKAVQGLLHGRWRVAIVDRFQGRRRVSRATLLGLAIGLAARWRRFPGERIGLALPSGIAGAAANLACVLAGKTPVNLNVTSGPAAFGSAIRQSCIQTIITADALRSRFENLPWPEDSRDFLGELNGIAAWRKIACLAAAWTLPAFAINALLGVPRRGGDAECALLFTSGSSGDPKGVVLTHRNVLGNILQISETNFLQAGDRILGCLPLFHSFGFTVTLWTPMLRGLTAVTLANPLDAKKIVETVREEKVTVLPSTATFLRPVLRKADPNDLRSLRAVVAGAEKLPVSLANECEDRFGVPVLEGYGLTETAPCLSVNMPDPPPPAMKANDQLSRRLGTTGRLLPGIAARIVDPDTGKRLPLNQAGILHVRGPNVFSGYYGRPDLTGAVLSDGWFATGDIVCFDDDGFLRIEGRLSRFSKIGGEMVPHATVEEKIAEIIEPAAGEDRPAIVVAGVPAEEKGEALVLLTTEPLDPGHLRIKLAETGLPNLWIPRKIVVVPEIPILGSGKLDLKEAQRLAMEGAANENPIRLA